MTEEGSPARGLDMAAAVERLDRTMAAPLDALRRAEPKHKGSDPLYNVPWYLFLGPSAEAIQDVLRSASRDAGGAGAGGEGDPDCWQWWRLRRLTAIAWPCSLLCSPDDRERWQLVERAMSLLAGARKHLPLNGIVYVLPVEDLIGSRDAVERGAQRLRDIVNELRTTLSLRFPTTVVVTGLDRLPGHDVFFGRALAGTEGDVLGVRLEPEEASGDVAGLMAATFDGWRDRLHGIRMSLMRRPGESADNEQIFRLVHEFDRLRDPLVSFVETLFAASPADNRRPQWRALYLTAPGGPAPHLKDLFDRFLPVDASLARRA